jgi:aminoglycoside/choline kinase family phosphotransferase
MSSSTLATPSRLQQLQDWVKHVLRAPNLKDFSPISGDAGFRQYYRFTCPAHSPMARDHVTLLAVDAPPASENSVQFIAVAQYLARAGIKTPSIFYADTDNGFLIIEDFGDELLYKSLTAQHLPSVDELFHLYEKALHSLLTLQQVPPASALIPNYDETLLSHELSLCPEWFIKGLLKYSLDEAQDEVLKSAFKLLIENATQQQQSWVHRDYHSRNLIDCADSTMGVIDFQGALFGPITYDLASLLKDCYIYWPQDIVANVAIRAKLLMQQQGSLPNTLADAEFLRQFDLMGLQRHLKVLGIFARLHLRDEKSSYLKDLPRVLRYVVDVTARYPQLQPLHELFATQLFPAIEQQPWFSQASTELTP